MKTIQILAAFVLPMICLQSFSQNDSVILSDTNNNITSVLLKKDTVPKEELNEKLLEAAEQGKVDALISLLLRGADVNAHNYDGVSALMYASQNGYLDIVKILVYNGANVNAKPWDGSTALMAATRFGHYEIMDHLIQHGADLNARDSDSCTALFYAAVYGYFIPADMLVFYGADIKNRANDSSDALIAACFFGSTDIAQMLIRKGADINSTDKNGWTPLHCAAFGNHYDIVKILADTGAALDLKNSDGYTALAIACEMGYQNITEYLMDKKANPNIYTNSKANPLILSLYNSHFAIAKSLKSCKTLRNKWKPYIDAIDFSVLHFDMNNRDFMYGVFAGLHETRYMSGFHVGYSTRLWADRIQIPITENSFYQVWERRSMLYAEAEKVFRFNNSALAQYQKGIFISAKELYTYGKYYGLNQKPEKKFLFSPSVGYALISKYITFRFAYEYIDFGIKDFSPHRITLTLSGRIPVRSLSGTFKRFDWL